MARKLTPRPPGPTPGTDESVVFVNDAADWPPDLLGCITHEGYAASRIEDLSLAPSFLRNGGVRALFVGARPLGAKDLLLLRECREVSPSTAVVVMTTTPTQPDLKRAFESGATAFLSWPASPEVVRRALSSGGSPSAAPSSGKP